MSKYKVELKIFPKGGVPIVTNKFFDDVNDLRNRTKDVILRNIIYHQEGSGRCFIEMTVTTSEGEHYAHDEWWVYVDLQSHIVTLIEGEPPKELNNKLKVKFIVHLKGGHTFYSILRITKEDLQDIISTFDEAFQCNNEKSFRLGDTLVRLSDCSAVNWRVLNEQERA